MSKKNIMYSGKKKTKFFHSSNVVNLSADIHNAF